MNHKTCLVYGDVFLRHDTGPFHPESPARLESVMKGLARGGLSDRLLHVRPEPAPLPRLEKVHSGRYIREAREISASGAAELHTTDNPVSPGTFEAALNASGAVLKAVDAVMGAAAENAFCAVRPPGHHALFDRAMGFCFFNNIAVGARYIQEACGLPKIAIIDWDAHHGNGTQDAFYRDPDVLYASIHQHPLFPGTGSEDEKGADEGLGFNLNFPVAPGSGDGEYAGLLEREIIPALEDFSPDFVLVSAGFDAHKDDPVGGLNVSTEGFARLTALVKSAASRLCAGRLVSVLEGGYCLGALSDSVRAHLEVMSG